MNILNFNNIWEIILIIILLYYFALRVAGKRLQKKEGWNNFEFWAYYHLIDLYKFYGFPYPERRAKIEINKIIKNKKNDK